MAKIPQSKDEALEALDFIVNVLKEHEKDLDKLINELGTVTEQIGDTGELSGKVEKVEEKINSLQKEVTNLNRLHVKRSKGSPQTAPKNRRSATAPRQPCFFRRSLNGFKMSAMGGFLDL